MIKDKLVEKSIKHNRIIFKSFTWDFSRRYSNSFLNQILFLLPRELSRYKTPCQIPTMIYCIILTYFLKDYKSSEEFVLYQCFSKSVPHE